MLFLQLSLLPRHSWSFAVFQKPILFPFRSFLSGIRTYCKWLTGSVLFGYTLLWFGRDKFKWTMFGFDKPYLLNERPKT